LRFPALLFEAFLATKLDARATFCLRAADARPHQVVDAVLNVRAKLLVDVSGSLGAMKKPSPQGTKVG